jgi:hypothetical protein
MPLLTIVVNGFDSNPNKISRGNRKGLGGYVQAFDADSTISGDVIVRPKFVLNPYSPELSRNEVASREYKYLYGYSNIDDLSLALSKLDGDDNPAPHYGKSYEPRVECSGDTFYIVFDPMAYLKSDQLPSAYGFFDIDD